MPQHTEAKKRKSDTLGEEDPANFCRYVCKSIANDANDQVLKKGGVLDIRRSLIFANEVALVTELIGKFEDCCSLAQYA